MRKFEKFIFESYEFNSETLVAKFYYSFDSGLEIFEETIDFKVEQSLAPDLKRKFEGDSEVILNNFLFQLHIALGISYYKLYPTQILEVKSGYLHDEQILFWEKFYRNGLGEFFITNDIHPEGLIQFKNSGTSLNIEDSTILNNYIESSSNFIEGKTLLLWGGGKDSIASYSVLKDKKDLDLFVFGKLDEIKKTTAEISGENLLLVKRTLSNNIFRLNKEGYYNGHVPITGIIAFVTFVTGYLYGYSNIVLSNEKSASEENTVWNGLKINHQYSKSLEFEQDLQYYVSNFISKDISYFSLLRGMYEYKIAQLFSSQKQFFQSFSSCNRNFRINTLPPIRGKSLKGDGGIKKLWCGECEKCCFVFLILSAHLEEAELLSIFGENLFEKSQLESTFRELIGFENHKPFECVGTYEECLLSAKKAINKFSGNLPYVLKNLEQEVEEKCSLEVEEKLENKLLEISEESIIPEQFKKLL